MLHSTPSASHAAKIFSDVADCAAPSALVSSWRRCVTIHGLKPDGLLRPAKREHHHIAQAREASDDLVRAAARPMDQLFKILPSTDHVLYLTDADGTVVETLSHRVNDLWERPRRDWIGSDFSEAGAGTNGVGTVLRERRPMTIAGNQHFFVSNTIALCSGAPVFDAEGELRGCIDLTLGVTYNDPVTIALTLAAVIETARRIELRLFADLHPGAKLVMASQTAPNPAALFAVDRHGAVVGATRAARTSLHLKADQVRGVFSAEQLWGLGDARDLSRSAAEKRAIEAALAKHHGNVSAAAKTVGISRSTFYRKVSDYRLEAGPRALSTAPSQVRVS